MPTEDMSVDKARRIRRILLNLVDKSEIYPRRGTHIDSVSLALFWRMAELHESICSLVVRGHRRDAAVLGRTLCEALITCYWLTNKDQDRRFDRYVNFWGKVRHENIARTTKLRIPGQGGRESGIDPASVPKLIRARFRDESGQGFRF